MTRRIWVCVGLVPAATLAAALVAGSAAPSHSTARNAFVIKEADAVWAEKAGVQEGPTATYEAEQAARTRPLCLVARLRRLGAEPVEIARKPDAPAKGRLRAALLSLRGETL